MPVLHLLPSTQTWCVIILLIKNYSMQYGTFTPCVLNYVPAYMGMTHSQLPQNNSNLPLPFFDGNQPIVLLDKIY